MSSPAGTVLRSVGILGALALAAGACGDTTESGSPGSTTSPEPVTTMPQPSTSAPPNTTTTAPALPGGDLERCESPEGFAISAPVSWATNEGDVVPRCGQFDPEPFRVPRGTDERVAAISVYVERVPFATAARPREGRDEARAVTATDGRQAVRVSYRATGEGLYPEGIPITSYLVDFGREDGDQETLILDTVGTPPFDYETNVVVLDRMFQTLDITDESVASDRSVIAAYRGGGGGFTVTAQATGGRICLEIPPRGEPVCTDPPGRGQVHTIALRDLTDTVHAGVTGAEVWRVELVTPSGESHSYLPAPVPGHDSGAYAFHDTVGGVDRLVLYKVTGEELRTVRPGGG
jgi:hypothetical protein